MNPTLRCIALLFALAPAALGQGREGLRTGLAFLPDPHQGGQAAELRIADLTFGRLVDVYEIKPNGVRVRRFKDFLIGPSIQSNGVDWELKQHPLTLTESLTILHRPGSAAYQAALQTLDASPLPVLDKGLSGLPPFSMVPRNAALSMRCDDLLDASTVTPENVRTLVGYPPAVPFELRILADPSHGGVVGGQFHSTRVLLDFQVTTLEAQALSIPINLLGLPGATTTTAPNAVVRVPTQIHPPAGQFTLLTNLAGNGMAFNGNGSNDPTSPTLDVVRAFRSGGESSVTGDPFEGFLPDSTPPRLVAAQPVQVTAVNAPPANGRDGASVDLTFNTLACAQAPRVGDVIELPNHVLLVVRDGAAPAGGAVAGVRVRLLVGTPTTLFPGVGLYRTPWDPAAGQAPECFLTFSPAPANPPNAGVSPLSGLRIGFSEPMDPNSLDPFDTFTVEHAAPAANSTRQRVVGRLTPSVGLNEVAFDAVLPLRNHGNPSLPPEAYTVILASGPGGPRDLAGNPLADALPPTGFTLDPGGPAFDTGSVSLTFDSADEDGNGAPELRGQFLYDLAAGVIRPRPVSRFSAQVDPTTPWTTTWAMVPVPTPVQTPLSPFGSKLMSVWRYHDLGFDLLDDTNHNLDLEGLWWEPFGGAVSADAFAAFQMSVGHARYLPDENVATSLLPTVPGSGLVVQYDGNWLNGYGGAQDPPQVVHPKASGYAISPLDVQTSANNRVIAPWPLNRGVPPAQFTYWTWRDTASLGRAAPLGHGAETRRLSQLGTGVALLNFWSADDVPTVALPLLMEFRTYPDPQATGLNGLQVAIAINSSARPYFRTFSTGGVLANGSQKVVDPDLETSGTGGVNPQNGLATPPQDNAFYFGQADFVVRVNRLHTIWFDLLGPTTQVSAALTPPANRLPAGTQVALAFRGASAISSGTAGSWEDATNLDPYGDSYTSSQHQKLGGSGQDAFVVTEFPTPGDDSWNTTIFPVWGARYVQARVTMIGQAETGLTPEVAGLGFAWLR